MIHLFDEDGSIESAFRRSLEQPGVLRGGIPRVLSLFFKDMIRGHNNLYDRLREQIEFLEDKVWSSKKVDQLIGEEISEINHELLLLYNYYEQLSDFCETLEDNENEIFTEKGLGHIRSLNNIINHEYFRSIMIKISINGFGRIGRSALKILDRKAHV